MSEIVEGVVEDVVDHAEEKGDAAKPIRYKKIKWVARNIVRMGTMKIVMKAIANNTESDEKEKRTDRLAISAASFAVGGIVSDATADWTDKFVEEKLDQLRGLTKVISEFTEELDSEES